jgi:hypothetical protein
LDVNGLFGFRDAVTWDGRKVRLAPAAVH